MFKWFFLLISTAVFCQDITGFWKSYNEKTLKPEIMVAIYPYQGKYYGRIVGIYNKKGEIKETLTERKNRAPGIVGEPFYCGLDLIYDLKNKGSTFNGKIVDPEKGNVYSAELWRDKEDLIVRGKLFIFGKNLTWYPAKEEDFSEFFPKPNVSQFVPVIPKTK
jgi:uncharacterized protein (DUF2147 family)